MIPKNLLADLAPYDPINQDEMGGCVWCGGAPPERPYGDAGRFKHHHAPDCPWVRARKRLGDYLDD